MASVLSLMTKILDSLQEYHEKYQNFEGYVKSECGYKALLKRFSNAEMFMMVKIVEKLCKKSDITKIPEVVNLLSKYDNEYIDTLWSLLFLD